MNDELFIESGLSLDRLRVLCEVIHHKTIAQATGRDSSRASHYSRQIAELEKYFGVKLFLRKNRRLIPTSQAMQLNAIVRHFFDQLTDFREEAKGRMPTIRIGAQESVIKWFLMPHIAEWQSQFSDVKFTFQNHRTKGMIELLTEGQLDLAVIREDAMTAPIRSESLCKLTYGLFIPKSVIGKLPGRVTVKILKDIPLATLSHHGRFSAHLNDIQDLLGEKLNIFATCNSFSLIVEMMKVQEVAAILPIKASRDVSKEHYHIIQPSFLSPLERTLVLAYLRDENFVKPLAKNIAILMSRTI